MSKAKKLMVVAGSALLGLFLLVVGFKEYRTSKKLQSQGQQTVGVVTDSDTQRGRKGRRSHYLTVLYKTEAKATFEQRQKVSRAVFDDAAKAGSVQVTYLPSNPNVCAFGPKVKTNWGMMVFGVLALAAAGATAFSKSEQAATAAPAADAGVEKELVADKSKYDDQQKAA